MNRSDFQQLAEVRIDEAGVLLAVGKWDGAYYLAGYAAECALKACVAKLAKADEFPPRDVKDYYTHDLNKLVKTADLDVARDTTASAKPRFKTFWTLIAKWSEQSRYERRSQADAQALYDAIADPTDGVLQWLRGIW